VRAVSLTGEAFFAVAKDGRAFVVQTPDASVQVLGTRFDVRGPVAGQGTRVAVEEGRVAVQPRGGRQRAELGAGEVALVRGGEAVAVPRANPARLMSWRTGGLAAMDEPLAVVLAEVARRAGLDITLDSAAAAIGPVSVYYPDTPAPATVVADLATAHGLSFARTNRGFAVRQRAAPR
jgi:transmembrane sensor